MAIKQYSLATMESFDFYGGFPVDVRGGGTPGSNEGAFIDFVIGELERQIAKLPTPDFSVGPAIDRRDIGFPTLRGLPTLVPEIGGTNERGIFKEDIGRRIPQIKEVLQVQAPPIALPIPQVRTGPSTTVGGPSDTKIHTGEAKMPDLGLDGGGFGLPGWGDIFDLGVDLLGFGAPVAGPGVPAVVTPPVVAAAPASGGGGIPPMSAGASCESDPRNQYVMKFICGQWKWVKKRKRRSKRLATASDIKDLSALQGVLGSGKNLTTWIATHR